MSSPAFLIDGFTEKLVLEKICPQTKINRINCNGNSVTIQAIAKRVATLIRLINGRYYPIIVIIDREDREATVEEIEQMLFSEIREAGIEDDIRVGVCDRMIENWIIADWESFTSSCESIAIEKPSTTDGTRGKSLIKKAFPLYQETTDGVGLLLNANPRSIYDNSPSFRKFIDKIHDIECRWINSLF